MYKNKYVSREEFLKFGGEQGRWEYISKAIEFIKECNPSTILELGCAKVPLTNFSITMDKAIFDVKRKVPTILYNATKFPYPFKDNSFDVFVALQVFEHLSNKQVEAFQEAKRISKNIILSLPYKWKRGSSIHRNIDERTIKKWAGNIEPNKTAIKTQRIICVWNF